MGVFDDELEPRDLGAVSHHAGWVSAHRGLRIYHTAIVIQIVLLSLTVLLGLALAGARSRSAAEIYVVVTSILSLLVSLVALVGLARYVRVPSISGGQGLAVAALVLASTNFVISVVQNIGALTDIRRAMRSGGLGSGLSLIALLAGLAMLITFILSMGRVAAFIGRPEIQAGARNVLALLVALIIGGVFMVAIMVGTRGVGGGGITLILALIVLGLAIWMLVAYLKVISSLSIAIQTDVGIERAFD